MSQSLLPRCQQQSSYSWWIDILFLTVFLTLLAFTMLASRPLFVPDEGRYAEIAREMVVSNDYLTPHLNGIKYFEKPALFYWLTALAIKLTGLNLWSVRAVNALLSILGCLATYVIARQLYGRKTGILAALILASSTLYFVMAHMVSLDLPITVFLALSLYLFLLSMQPSQRRWQRYYLWSAFACSAAAVLTKGLIGIVFPMIIAGAWILLFNQWQIFRYWFSCLLIFFLIVAPWHILVSLQNPEFAYFYFIQQHFLRYSTMNVGHYQPIWFFIPCLILGFFPWSVFMLQAIVQPLPKPFKITDESANELFFILWIVSIFLFFSFSKSKLIPYILPIFPPLAIMTARYLTIQKHSWGMITGYILLSIFGAILAYVLLNHIQHLALPDLSLAQFYLSCAVAVLVSGIIVAMICAYYRPLMALSFIIMAQSLFLLSFFAAIPFIDTRSILPLANIVKPLLQPKDEVVTYNQYYQDLPFYLERHVGILNWKNELSYGMSHQKNSDWMLNDHDFWRIFNSDQRVFVFINKEEYHKLRMQYPQKKFHILGETVTTVLISNR